MGSNAERRPFFEFDLNRLTVRMDVSVGASAESVGEVVDGIMKVVTATKCACGHEFELELSMREALANAVLHGAGADARKQVRCCVACDPERGLLVIVRDPGKGFDPASLPSPLYGEQLYSEHGRGLFLINQLMDDVEFAKGGAEIRMRKRPAEPCQEFK